MSTPIDNGGPAFPVPITSAQPGQLVSACELGAGGMSLRDWFAGQALAGWLASFGDSSTHPIHLNESVAFEAYKTADAMLVERTRQKGTQ